MARSCVIYFFTFLSGVVALTAQVFPDCINAVPICNNTPINGGTTGMGIDDFNGATVSGCIALATGTIENNSAWYRFRTNADGQLGFNIGHDATEDWDFALYQTDDCTNLGDPVRCNYFDNSDNNNFIGVGEDPTGADNFQYDELLEVSSGQDFYLFINNFSNTNSGFSIQFSGTVFTDFPNTALDCSIVNNLLGPPIAACDNESVMLDATSTGAISYEWYLDLGSGFNRITGENGAHLNVTVSGFYRVVVVMPSGMNVISETQVAFSELPVTHPLDDELVCLDGTTINLSQKNNEALGGQDPDSFRISYHTSMTDAIQETNPLQMDFEPTQTVQTIYVRTTSIENPNCFDASQTFNINGLVLPDVSFPTTVYICEDTPTATIGLATPEMGINYLWDTGETTASIMVVQEGVYTLTATNTQGTVTCVSVGSVSVVFSRPARIADVEIEYIDERNIVSVLVEEAGEFNYQVDNEIPQDSNIFNNLSPGEHTITVADINGCGIDTLDIVVLGFPNFFTPNGDGTHDTWRIQSMDILENPIVSIFNQFGKLIVQLDENSAGWNGTFNGAQLPEDDYWFSLSYTETNGPSSTTKYIKDHFSLKR
ncbi:T9SS type B sorting domain-containing protein [Maribacter sp. 2210JD10-5]|uniref:T9SS type B sorting domain-containing protein n=1 Tax=Maribacter sp. 2210JD10-5 TaxID=3386272 RepID=UPI0039BCA324